MDRLQEVCILAQAALRGILFQIRGFIVCMGQQGPCLLSTQVQVSLSEKCKNTPNLTWAIHLWAPGNQVRERAKAEAGGATFCVLKLACFLASFKSTCQGSVASFLSSPCLE